MILHPMLDFNCTENGKSNLASYVLYVPSKLYDKQIRLHNKIFASKYLGDRPTEIQYLSFFQ